MNQRHPDTRIMNILSATILLLVVAYFSMQIWTYFTQPFTTVVMYQYQDDESVQLSGMLVREEQVLTNQDSGVLDLTRQEGDKVSVGGTVARVYSDAESAQESQELQLARNLVEQLTFAQSATQSAEASLRLDEQIADTLIAYQQSIVSGRWEDSDDAAVSLRSLVRQRDFSYDGATVSADLTSATAQLSQLAKATYSASKTIKATASGLYSAVVDGYEGVLTPEMVEDLTPSTLAALQPDMEALSNVGKMVLGDTWYYVATVSQEVGAQAQKAGSVGLQFTKGLAQTLDMRVHSVSAEEEGNVVLVLESREYLSELTLLRNQSAELIFDTITGYRVPLASLRVNEDGVQGIYCVVGLRARFKPVNILYEGADFMLVESGTEQASLQLRSGDQVIIAARDLYDGMVVE